MRKFFSILTIGLILVGFFNPAAWVAAIITGIIAIGCAPAGYRPDGKRKTGGLLGGFWDGVVIGYKMKECPFCKFQVSKDAQKCPNCGEWL